jgi:pilus assembly protein CpaD
MTQPFNTFACALMAGALLTACQSPFNGRDDALTAETMHPIAVDTHLISQSIEVPTETFTLSAEDRDNAASLIADYRQRGLGRLSITSPTGTPNAAAGIEVAAELTEIARAQGVSPKRVAIAGYSAATNDAAPPVIVSFTVYQATASPCGDFSRNEAFTPLNQLSPDHGCATQHNLAEMVEDPRDLVAPRGEGPSDTQRRQTTLDKYRKGQVTAADKTDQSSGAVSEVNK